jgi:hypothetical protein
MATQTATKTPAVKTPRKTVNLVDRTKSVLSTAALKNKITVEELATLKSHIEKLTALLA